MQRRRRSGGALLVALGSFVLAVAACKGTERAAPSSGIESEQPRLEVVLINGGEKPASNYQSHLLHIRQLHHLLRRSGIPESAIAIFSSDGSDPEADLAVREVQRETDFWLLRGTRLERSLRTQTTYENSEVGEITLRPATDEALRTWFQDAAGRLRRGETLLLYVTDHGTKNKEDPSNNRITLWGKDESLSVTELRELVGLLDPGVRVVALMSQCYSGSFANLMYTGEADVAPRGNVCGFYSSTAERFAYGCYPENLDKDNVGHSFRFIDALDQTPSFPEAHDRVLVTDRTPDVPLKTSDVYLRTILDAAARERGQQLDEYVDELLLEAWRNKGAWEPEIRLLDRIGQAFGYFSPRSLSELQEQSSLLPVVSRQFHSYSKAWRAALHSLASENLDRFVADNPSWEMQVSDKAVRSLDTEERRALTEALLVDLADYTRAETETAARLDLLKEKAQVSKEARYRMQVRLGVVLRMEAVLTGIAGRVYVANHATESERNVYAALVGCEALTLPRPEASPIPPVVPDPFPSYDEEIELAQEVLPGWMGIRFRQASATRRAKFGLEAGAVSVLAVYPDSPAREAGLEVGDIVLGPPDAPFTEPQQIREWAMTAPIDEPEWLRVQRGHQKLRISLRPKPYPLKWPALPGPPKVGSLAPPLQELQPYRGTLPAELASGGPYLLFFWASWCAPCKAALPEVMAFERERQTQVIAISDELPDQLDAFFEKHDGPFPEAVAVDELRRSFLAYGVSGTPSFVLVDAAGKVRSTSTGYKRDRGLGIADWSWAK
jgi:thiol-disulfide isomerase/thioredoxin